MNTKSGPSEASTADTSAGPTYTIGDASARLGMPASTIRFYEKNGLIPNQ